MQQKQISKLSSARIRNKPSVIWFWQRKPLQMSISVFIPRNVSTSKQRHLIEIYLAFPPEKNCVCLRLRFFGWLSNSKFFWNPTTKFWAYHSKRSIGKCRNKTNARKPAPVYSKTKIAVLKSRWNLQTHGSSLQEAVWLVVHCSPNPIGVTYIPHSSNDPPITRSNTGSLTDFPSLCVCSESSLTNLPPSPLPARTPMATTMLKLYKAFVLPHFQYCSAVWDFAFVALGIATNLRHCNIKVFMSIAV